MSSLRAGSLRRAIRIRGTVQGVGFRPAIYRFASGLGLSGFVRNELGDVWLEVEGEEEAVSRFVTGLRGAAPASARIESLETEDVAPRGERDFKIIASASAASGELGAGIPADLGPCAACLAELEDPSDRRHRYPFINCTDCGPRFTILRELPYDRARTTMRAFALCPACRLEYEDPKDRRFHAEPNACPQCGPSVTWVSRDGTTRTGEAALAAAAGALAEGEIVAVKGAGGFALATDAANERAVARLRRKKHRPHKPFAVIGRSLEVMETVAVLSEAARRALTSPARPIVLVPRRPGSPGLAPSVAPGLCDIGLFLPPTPLQHLLAAGGAPLQVMTSGNRGGEPIARTDKEALARLGSIADGFLLHDRDIEARADDSVLRIAGGAAVPIRRARGYVPASIPLPPTATPVASPEPTILALGGDLKNTICLARGGRALLSQHIGDLHHPETHAFFERTIDRFRRLLCAQPAAIAHDLHPDYRSTLFAASMARESEVPRIAVQHHHAHIAACLAEHQLVGPAFGVAFDGTGYGEDGGLWGGEILLADFTGFRRLAHLRPIALAGGEAAIREPWRLALAALLDAGEPADLLSRIDPRRLRLVREVLGREATSPRSTGAGRWFDAVAALAGLRDRVSYEGQAAAELESIAAAGDASPYEVAFEERAGEPRVIDLRPAIRQIAVELRRGGSAASVSARFHETLARAIRDALRRAREPGAPELVVLSGGCFQNRRLGERVSELLEADRLCVVRHRRVPPGDGGLALGQAAVARAILVARRKER